MKTRQYLWKIVLGSSVAIAPAIALISCSSSGSPTKSFAELVVSDDNSVLKDKAFNEKSYIGWHKFMTSSAITNEYGNPAQYTKETFDMPEINSGHRDLDLAKGYWRRPGGNAPNSFRQILNSGANLIIAPGFNQKDSVQTVANEMKNKGFILLDSGVDVTKGDFTNVSSFTFRAEQSGFLAGIATAEFLNANKEIFTNKSNGDDGKLKVGGFVGSAFPSTTDFLAGFQAGIIAYNLQIKSNTTQPFTTKTEVEWASLGKDIGNYASGGFAPGQGVTISEELINKHKVDAIIPIAGPQTADAISVITGSKRPAIVVGVDSEQELNGNIQKEFNSAQLNNKKLKNADGTDMEKQNIIQFSAIKKLDEAVYQILASIFNETNPNNSSSSKTNQNNPVKGFGYNNIGTLSNKTVGVSQSGLQWVKAFDDTWVTGTDLNSYAFSPTSGIYDNEAYKHLESVGVLYNDALTSLTAISDLTNKTQVAATKFIDDTNRVVTKLDNNNPAATLNKNQNSISLNGSIWSLEKGKIKNNNTTITKLKKYKIN